MRIVAKATVLVYEIDPNRVGFQLHAKAGVPHVTIADEPISPVVSIGFTILEASLSDGTCSEAREAINQGAHPIRLSPETHRRRTLGLLALVVIPKPVSNLFLTWGVRHFPHVLTIHPSQYVLALFNPLVFLGIVVQICWLLGRMTLLSMADLSFVVPVTATGYIISALLGRIFLHEQVTVVQWLGIFLITAGAVLVAPTIGNLTRFQAHGDQPTLPALLEEPLLVGVCAGDDPDGGGCASAGSL